MKQNVYFLSGTMCNEKLWQFVFSSLEFINPVYIDITSASSFKEINELIDQVIIAPAIIVGFSMGGFSALNYTISNIEKVEKLVLISMDAEGLNAHELRLRKSTIEFLEKHKYKGISNARILQFLHSSNHNNTSLINIIKEMDADLGKEILIRQLQATSQRTPLVEKLNELKIRILLVGAVQDGLVAIEGMKKMHALLSNAQFESIDDSGHMIPLEQPSTLAHLIGKFL